jgi:hypothetical protein
MPNFSQEELDKAAGTVRSLISPVQSLSTERITLSSITTHFTTTSGISQGCHSGTAIGIM